MRLVCCRDTPDDEFAEHEAAADDDIVTGIVFSGVTLDML